MILYASVFKLLLISVYIKFVLARNEYSLFSEGAVSLTIHFCVRRSPWSSRSVVCSLFVHHYGPFASALYNEICFINFMRYLIFSPTILSRILFSTVAWIVLLYDVNVIILQVTEQNYIYIYTLFLNDWTYNKEFVSFLNCCTLSKFVRVKCFSML